METPRAGVEPTPATRPAGVPAAYPRQWEADVVLSDGGTVHLRPIRPADAPALADFHSRLSPESIYFRFFSPRPTVSPRDLAYFTQVDYERRFALVAELGGHVIAIGRFDRRPGSDEAEVAFVVEDAHQGRGLGSLLLEHLAAVARSKGIHVFVAETLPENRRMLSVFHDAGYCATSRFEEGVIRVRFPIDSTSASQSVTEERERLAEVRSVAGLLAPRGVAVIGETGEPGGLGHDVLRSLLAGGYVGRLVPVHPEARQVLGLPAVVDVREAEGELDLAIVAVPGPQVEEAVRACGERGLRGVVVASRLASRRGAEEDEALRRLAALAHLHGMRLVGPRSLGLLNTAPGVRLFALPVPFFPTRGGVGFLSHSGALGIAVLEWAVRRGIGMSSFVSVGDKADLSGNDLLQYWEEDEATRVILLSLESFGNPRKFARIARRVARKKPIVALKAGRSRGALRAAGPEALGAAGEPAVDVLFQQAGVLRVDTLEELFDVARVLEMGRLPRGRRVAIVGNASGPAVVAADACEGNGLEVPVLGAATREALAAALPEARSVENPVDLDGPAEPDALAAALRLVLADPAIDAAIAVVSRPRPAPLEAVGAALAAVAGASEKPVLLSLLAQPRAPSEPGALPAFPFPEAAARALARAAAHAAWRARPEGTLPTLRGVDPAAARKLVDEVLAGSPRGAPLEPSIAARLLACYGVAVGEEPARGGAGRELVLAVRPDPGFGPLAVLRAAGATPGLEAFRILPLTDADALELAERVMSGLPALARTARRPLVDLLLRVARLVEDAPEVAELRLAPVRPSSRAVVVGAASGRLAPLGAPRELRRLGRPRGGAGSEAADLV